MRKFNLMMLMMLASLTLAAASMKPKVPTDGQKNVSVNAQIVVQGPSSIVLAKDSCLLNGEHISVASVAASMAIFRPGLMDFAAEYTLEVPDGAFTLKDGTPLDGCTVHFTTASPQAKVFDAIVAADGSGDYTSIRAAVKAAPTNRVEPWIIFVKNGVYEELVRTASNQTYISLVGEDPEKTILKFSITSNGGHERDQANFTEAEGRGPVLVASAPNFYLHNISVINAWGYEKQNGPQALALGSYTDRFTMFNTRLISYQDTWQTGSDEHRHYARRCYVEGAVDFIYCSGDVVLDSCTLGLSRNGSVIVAPSHGAGVKYGYVFRDTKIVSSKPGTARTNNSYGRPWHNFPRTSFINTTWSKDITFSAAGWTDHMGGLPVVFAEYNTRNYLGQPVDLSKRNTYYYKGDKSNPEGTCTAQAILTKEEADALTVKTVLSGSDAWTPDRMTVELPAPELTYHGATLSWSKIDAAICYLVMRDGEFYKVTTDTSMDVEGDVNAYTVRAVNYYGTMGQISKAPFVSGIQAEKVADLDALFDGQALRLGHFEGVATVEMLSLDGRLLSKQQVSSEAVMPVAAQVAMARITAPQGTLVLKCLR